VTHIMIFAMIGLSVALTPLLRNIPMPVLFGVFLYMGAASLKGLQFFDRILIMFMPLKYQPDYMFLRQVPLKRVHIFTAIQLTCLIALWVIKSFKQTSILFPLMVRPFWSWSLLGLVLMGRILQLVVMIGIRKCLDFFFTRRELKILDDVMPETSRRSAAEKLTDGEDDDEESADVRIGNLRVFSLPFRFCVCIVSGSWKESSHRSIRQSANSTSQRQHHENPSRFHQHF
jgi:sodium bicarbonate transporter 10